MMKPLHPILARIVPYFMIAFMILLFVVSIFIFSYILIITVFIGLILFVIGYIRAKFFSHGKQPAFHEEILIIQQQIQDDIKLEENETNKPAHPSRKKSTGRIIEHDDTDRT